MDHFLDNTCHTYTVHVANQNTKPLCTWHSLPPPHLCHSLTESADAMLVLGKHKEMMQLIKKWVIEHTSEIPYSGKLSREKTFANWWKIQFSRRKLSWITCFYHAACQRMPHPKISLRKLLRIATKSQNLGKFSPSKVSHYTVHYC